MNHEKTSKYGKNFLIFLVSLIFICLVLIGFRADASELSQQEIEMRKMVLEMVSTSMLQSCEGLQTLECIDLDESDCKSMMSEVVTTCIEPAIDNPEFVDDGTCGNKVMARYGITQAAAQRCGVDIEAE